jgi:hypothetical protein
MKNFDEEALEPDLSFQVGGEVFQMRYVRPEVLAAWEDEAIEDKSEELLKRQDERILAFLSDKESRDRWVALREREDNAVPMVQVNELLRWMVEVQTSRPTTPPSPSATGPGKRGRSSGAE